MMENFSVTMGPLDGNRTDSDHGKHSLAMEIMEKVNDFVVPSVLVLIMLSMACGVTIPDLKYLVKKPLPAIMGLLSQFVAMPAAAFGYAVALHLSPMHSIALVVVASCPGGAVSNVFTFWTRGDLALSVFMTLVSTVLALGFLPLNMFLYLRRWTKSGVKIPFVQSVIIIVMTWIPVLIGILIRHKNAKVAGWIAKIGGVINMIFIIVMMLLQNFLSGSFSHLSSQSWIAGLTLPLVGFGVGILVSTIACLPMKQRRTVAIETGIQNVGVAMTLIAMSFEIEEASVLFQIPLVFALGQLICGYTITGIARLYYCIKDSKERKVHSEKLDEDEDMIEHEEKA